MYIFSTFFFILFWGWTRHVVRRLCQAQLRSSNNCRIFFFWFLKCCENTISNKIDILTNCFNQNTFLFQSLLKESFIFGLRFCFQYTWNGLSYSKTSKDPWSTCLWLRSLFSKLNNFFYFEFNYLEIGVKKIVLKKKLLCAKEVPNWPKN